MATVILHDQYFTVKKEPGKHQGHLFISLVVAIPRKENQKQRTIFYRENKQATYFIHWLEAN